MRFVLVDRILEIKPGHSLVAVKNLSLAEEYLGDHFPGFPVMPGVLMLEALTQAGAWLIRETEDYAHSVIVLKSAKAIKYGSFVAPGNQLEIRMEIVSIGERECTLKGHGTVDGQETVKGRITLDRYNLRDHDPALQTTDATIISGLRERFKTLYRGPAPSQSTASVEHTHKNGVAAASV